MTLFYSEPEATEQNVGIEEVDVSVQPDPADQPDQPQQPERAITRLEIVTIYPIEMLMHNI